MMNATEKRRGTKNAVERLQAAGALVKSVNDAIVQPVITVEFPPVWLLEKAVEIRERKASQLIISHVATVSGCLVRWTENNIVSN